MLKTKKGRIIFFTIVLLAVAVAIILVTVLMPTPSLLAAKENFDNFIATHDRIDNKENDVVVDNTEYYETSVLAFSGLNEENRTNLQNYYNINQAIFSLEDFITQNLTFTYRSDTYNSESGELQTAVNNAERAYEDFYEYCDTYVKPLIGETISESDQNNIAERFLEKYSLVTQANANVFKCASDVLLSSATRGIEVNEYSLTYVSSVCQAAVNVYGNLELANSLLNNTRIYVLALSVYNYTDSHIEALNNAFSSLLEVEA